ncbi:4'-phosphopantetheinyl transferase family protein [[Eubacterium] yurii subsp. margaretiae ATCC 43715]|nr:4'-phosphopantetheinyl transferase family protein [[Eubacterium] yurii subsp. margaretiae ATCC 43715]
MKTCKIFFAKLNKKLNSQDFIKYILYKYYDYNFEKIDIQRTKNGKPYIKDSNLSFNVSHTADSIIAIAGLGYDSVGIDMEVIQNKDREKIIKRFFQKEEIEFINSSEDKNLEFYKIWTKKEAYIKKNALNMTYISKINILKEKIDTFIIDNMVVSVCI